ncbi:MAG: hypothetical protein KA152_00065 [Verrucomicrobiales bacterium]|jgi:hypothetical protein|nr:hypothetical protein [Verrucomicrobiales bacterium]MBP9222490.1 hypothetical protein [Verrucomicrobiales bacterium]
MNLSKEQNDAVGFYDQHYSIVFDSELTVGRHIKLADQQGIEDRICRFCGLGKPNVTFRKVAHAVPEFLGNKSLVSQNECDACNEKLADEYEDHLSKWFGPMRTVSQIRGKGGVPTYKNKDIRIEMGEKGLEIGIIGEELESSLNFDGPFTFKIPVPTPAQAHVPLRAAKALLKVACSICPPELLSECQPTIEWLMSRVNASLSMFPVLFAFTPGPNPYCDGKVFLLRRKSDAKLPFLWCILATANYRFQFFVPFCPSDTWITPGEPVELTPPHFPDVFGDKWPHGKTGFGVFDWSGTEPVVREQSVSFNVDSVEKVDIKPDSEN